MQWPILLNRSAHASVSEERGAHLCGLSPTMGGVEDGWRHSVAEEAHGHWQWPWWALAMRRRTRRRRGPSVWSFLHRREARQRGGGKGGGYRSSPIEVAREKMRSARAHKEKGVRYGAGVGARWRSGGVRAVGNDRARLRRAGGGGGSGRVGPARKRERGNVGRAWKTWAGPEETVKV
jgi:hypothetical protein